MNEMIERVSDAILNTPNASDYRELVAKNAIKAMREPTEEMLEAGYDSVGVHAYKAMIDEILK